MPRHEFCAICEIPVREEILEQVMDAAPVSAA